ncbi:MAG: hypothetical protein SFZ24_06470 [Planctomycetota bacterium]|nr:hypothetical protein [Planctomycetota bacterium]
MADSVEAGGTEGGARLLRALESLRGRWRRVLVGSRLLGLAAAIIAAGTVLGLTDYFLRLPVWIRWLHWAVGVGLIAWFLATRVRSAWRFAPSLTDVALRVERARPELSGLAASAADFARGGDASRGERERGSGVAAALAAGVVRRAEEAVAGADLRGLVQAGPVWSRGAALGLAAAVCAGLLAANPAMWTIGAVRVAAPFAGAQWPQRTGVVDVTEGSVAARGAALPLRAAVTRSVGPIESAYLAVRYRLIDGGRAGAERRELLTFQGREVEAREEGGEGEGGVVRGALFERLVEPMAEAIEFRFETDDDATEWRRIELVPPPAVVGARAVITPPTYARVLEGGADGSAPALSERTESELGPGTDERAAAPRALAGSTVELTIELNKPLEIPESVVEVFHGTEAGEPAGATLRREGSRWLISWTLGESVRVPVRLRDEHGIESTDEAVYRFEAVADRPAAAAMTEPPSDRAVLPTAVVRVAAEGRDDIGLGWVALERSVLERAGAGEKSGPGGALEMRGEPERIAREDAQGRTLARVGQELSLEALELEPGDEVRLTALAIDVRTGAVEGAEPTRSAPRTLRIISEADFVEEIQKQLSDVRQTAIRIEQQQGELQEQSRAGRNDQATRRGQGQISERIARQGEQLGRLVERVRENRMDSRALEDMLGRAQDALNEAGRSSSEASKSLERAGEQAGTRAEGAEAAAGGREEESQEPGARGEREAARDQKEEERQGGEGASAADERGGAEAAEREEGAAGEPRGGATGEEDQQKDEAGGEQGAQQGSRQAGGEGAPQSEREGAAKEEREGAASEEAREGAREEAQAGEEPALQGPEDEALREAVERQQQVRDELGGLIEMLDRGEDNWVVRNELERLLREQQAVRGATQRAGQQTAGKSVEQLTEQERSELERIAEAQRQLAEKTAEAAREMREREKKLAEKDPSGASAMGQAARRAEQSRTAETQQRAAEQVGQNQTSQASRSQQQAEQDLQEMLNDLDQVERARDEVLRRQLASIIETLEGLVAAQEGELEALDARVAAAEGLAGLDEGMIRLNQNTLAVLEQIRGGGPELAAVAAPVSRALEAQTGAITEIRRPVLGERMVREFELRSLTQLRAALSKARELDEAAADRQRRKQLGELKKLYRAVLERQGAIGEEAGPFAGAQELSRRGRQVLRGLSERQGGIRAELAEILSQTKELRDAKVFEFAHRRMDATSVRVESDLSEARPDPAVRGVEAMAGLIRDVLESLEDPKPDPKKFAEGAQGGGQGGGNQSGQQPLIPPLKELMLLRRLQTQIADATRDAAGPEAGVSREEITRLGNEQRELMEVGREFVDRMSQPGFRGIDRPGKGAEPEPGAEPAEGGNKEEGGGVEREPGAGQDPGAGAGAEQDEAVEEPMTP